MASPREWITAMRSPSRSVSRAPLPRALSLLALILFVSSPKIASQQIVPSPPPKPADVRPEWKRLLGEYGPDEGVLIVLEKQAKLAIFKKAAGDLILEEQREGAFSIGSAGPSAGKTVTFTRDASGRATQLKIGADALARRQLGPEDGKVFQIQPVRPVEELRKEALAASPPRESGEFRTSDLVELTTLDSTIHLDIRYATNNDFLGTPVYTQARALLQRPAAEALVRAHRALKPFGYGLLIHDAYRPWYVTKIFWDATGAEGKIFVADPAEGSRHNRGCAVDLTLYDLQTGKAVEMTGTYDEMSPRSYPDYPGGTSLQRWHRDFLRRAMENEGFSIYEFEWWHFDYKDWRRYSILNVPFEKI